MTKPTIEEWIKDVREHAVEQCKGGAYIRLVKCCAIIEILMEAMNEIIKDVDLKHEQMIEFNSTPADLATKAIAAAENEVRE